MHHDEVSALFAAIASVRHGTSPGRPILERIGYSEFLAAALPSRFDSAHLVAELFGMLDLDRDGLITIGEFLVTLSGTSIAETQARDCMGAVSSHGDGFLTLRDFAH